MYARTAAFDAAILASHTVVVVADVLLAGTVVASGLPVLSGTVDVDGSADVRRRCSLQIVDPTGSLSVAAPGSTVPALSPYGREIRIRRGVQYPSGVTETLVVGTFRIASVDVSNEGDSRVVAVSGFDRSRSIARARFEAPYTVPAGKVYADEILKLLKDRLPSVVVQFIAVPVRTTPLLVFDQMADPWQAVTDMAAAIGCEVFFNPDGECIVQAVTAPGAVVWNYRAGANATVLSVDNSLDDEPGYNGVVVDGEPAEGAPVHVVVYDDDALSPTRASGPYGKVPRFYKSQLVTTVEQAVDAARAILIQSMGATEQLRFSAIPHPAHEANDLVGVYDPALGVDSTYVLSSFSIPLGLGAMSCTTHKRKAA